MQSRDGPQFVHLFTPAKLNLFLEISGKRPDGFHEIETLMVPIDLVDSICLSDSPFEYSDARTRDEPQTKESIDLECRWVTARAGLRETVTEHHSELNRGDLPEGRDNLAFRAAERLREAAGIERPIAIRIRKRIPSAAGLGGASSDAAAVLLGANQLWRLNWPATRLHAIAAELGSDVPFFLGSGAAVCRGRGERIEPTRLPRMHFVVVYPPHGLATKTVFQHCRPASSPLPIGPFVEDMLRGDLRSAATKTINRLQQPAESLLPVVAEIREAFERLDCLGHQMSGSGSSYFGVVRHARQARRVAQQLRALNIGQVYATATVPGIRWLEPTSHE